MTAEFTNPGDGSIIITFTYQADLTKVQDTLEKAGEYVYNSFPIYDLTEPETPILIPWDNLTNQQKLDVVDAFVKQSVMTAARARLVDTAVDVARQAAQTDDSIDLG